MSCPPSLKTTCGNSSGFADDAIVLMVVLVMMMMMMMMTMKMIDK
jgi:hypothetical protein